MTPKEIKEAVTALAQEIGPQAHISLDIKNGQVRPDELVMGYCRPLDWDKDSAIILVYAPDYLGALNSIRAEWNKIKDDVTATAVRKLALAIIEATEDIGECSDAALRGRGFAQADIDRYGKDACEAADKMASNGPFGITRSYGANAAE